MRAMRRSIIAFAVLASSFAHAAEPSIGGFGAKEQAWTLGLAAVSIGLPAVLKGPEYPRWRSPILLDGPVTRWIGATTYEGASRADTIADWSVAAVMGTSFVATGNSGAHGRWQAVQSYAITGIAASVTKSLFGRARPYVEQCRDNPIGQDCFSEYQNESFFSGHTAFTFTGAGLLCAMRGDAFCPAAIGVASATGILRVVGQQHYLTDVLLGAVVGWTSGYYLPRWRRTERAEAQAATFSIQLAW